MRRPWISALVVALALASCGGDAPSDGRGPQLSWRAIGRALRYGFTPWRVLHAPAHAMRRFDAARDLHDIHVMPASEPTVGAVEDLQDRVERLCACRDATCTRREQSFYSLARGPLRPRRGSSFVAILDSLDARAAACAAASP